MYRRNCSTRALWSNEDENENENEERSEELSLSFSNLRLCGVWARRLA